MDFNQQGTAAQPHTASNLGQTIAANRFVLSRRVGKGGFGDVYEGCDIWTNEDCAVKLERVAPKRNYLNREYITYQRLKSLDGIPEPVWYGMEGPFNIMVLPLLGSSLSDLMARFKRLSICTVLKLGIQMVSLLERVHSRNLLHRDIKPGNFLIGKGENAGKLYLIDFGLASPYRDANGRHIPYNSSAHFHGTDKYASINSHMKIESSRRDDLESIAYTLIYLSKGELPWQYVMNKAIRRKRMGQMKMRIPPEELCAGLPRCFEEMLRYAMSLEFGQDPNYSYLRSMFEQTLTATPGGWAAPFEWATSAVVAPVPVFYVSPVVTENDDLMLEDDRLTALPTDSNGNSSQGRSSPPVFSGFHHSSTPVLHTAQFASSSSWVRVPFNPQTSSGFSTPTVQYNGCGFQEQQQASPFDLQRRPSTSGPSDEMEIDNEHFGYYRDGVMIN